MRNPMRIDAICDMLKTMWKRVPDQRFGQLMFNFLEHVLNETGRDVFYIEDEDMYNYIKNYLVPIEVKELEDYKIMNAYGIWMPKWNTREVLIAKDRIRKGKNYIFFTEVKSMKNLYSYLGEEVVANCQLTSNGTIPCYAVPVNMLCDEGELPESLKPMYEEMHNKYIAYCEKKKNKK